MYCSHTVLKVFNLVQALVHLQPTTAGSLMFLLFGASSRCSSDINSGTVTTAYSLNLKL